MMSSRVAPGGIQSSGRAFGPDVDIMPRVADHRLLAGGAGRRVDAHEFALRDGEQSERIIVSQIGLDGEGEPYEVVNRMNILRVQADLIEFPLIKGDILIGVLHHFDQAGGLDRVQIISGGTFHLRLINGHTNDSFLS